LTDIQKLADKISLCDVAAPDDGRLRVTYAIVANEGPPFWVKRQFGFCGDAHSLASGADHGQRGLLSFRMNIPVMDGSSHTFARSWDAGQTLHPDICDE
jgi:hypothetical protein